MTPQRPYSIRIVSNQYRLITFVLICLFGLANQTQAQIIRLSAPRIIAPARSTNVPIKTATLSPPTPTPVASASDAQPNAATDENSAQPTEKEKSIDELRIEALLKAKFDRTPAGILKAWSQRNQSEETPKSKETKKPISATIANAYKGFVVFEVDEIDGLKSGQLIELQKKDSKTPIRVKILSIDNKEVSGRVVPPKAKAKAPQTTTDNNSKPDATTAKVKSEDTPEPKTAEVEEVEEAPESDPAACGGLQDQETQESQEADEPVVKEAEASTESAASESGTNQETDSSPATGDEKPAAQKTDSDVKDKATGEPNTDAGNPENEQPDAETDEPLLTVGSTFNVVIPAAVAKAKATSMADKVKQEVETFSRNVTLGNWSAVKEYLANLKPKNKADEVYGRLLQQLLLAMPNVDDQQAAQQKSQMTQRGETPPSSFLTPADILAITEAAPNPISIIDPKTDEKEDPSKAIASANPAPTNMVLPPGLPPEVAAQLAAQMQASATASGATPAQATPGSTASSGATATTIKPSRHLTSIASMIQKSKSAGYDFDGFLKKLTDGTTHFGGEDPEKKLTAANLLMKANMYEQAESFLPNFEEVDNQPESHQMILLRSWASQSTRRYANEKVTKWLDLTWNVNQKIVNHENANDTDKRNALTKLIELSTIVDPEVGMKWLDESFTTSTERGVKILANLGAQSAELARKASQVDETQRVKMLRMQNEAVEKFLELTPDIDDSVSTTLTLLAQNWITESDISVKNTTQTSRNGYMSIDRYGNYYWRNPNQNQGGRRKRPIKVGDVLEIVPSKKWQSLISPTLLTEIQKLQANLHLRINEEDQAFPFIEQIAATHPEVARDLVHEFLRTWTRNHNPNTDRNQRNPYIYMYGFDQKAESIPLTRSKQERNLKELTEWVARIKKMPIDDVDEKLLSNAFTTCHSTAEVYKIDRVRNVFGDLKKLKPETIAALAQTMRSKLSQQWRQVKLQESKQTKRKLPELQEEVLEGYETAATMVKEALQGSPKNWKLQLAKACILYDENDYAQSVQKSSEYSDKKDLAFAEYAKAASLYAEASVLLDKKKQSTDVFDRWFYAALGAVDLGQIKAKNQPTPKQYALIKAAIDGLPGELAKDHMSKFANNLFTRMSPIKPELKFRYLKGGFEIVGDHPRAWEAKNLFNYYQDLVTEIQLDVSIDGDEIVGTKPFGLYVKLKHTPEIERESGGFGKYVQNQNSMMYAYNYGRPTEDYRDKFRDSIDQALGEHFEILSVTFEAADTMKSRPSPGNWRVTPYAYIMLKSKGSEVDRVAPLQLDLDFLDTSGYVVIPIESPALVIDSASEATTRPIADLQVTQTLDERQSGEGKLIVEVSASGKGLIPDLEEIIDLKVEDFEVAEIDDQGSLPTTFDSESDEIQILSDRSWTVEYRAKDSTKQANTFAFGTSKREDAKVEYQRYEDADLVAAEPIMQLEADYAGSQSSAWYLLLPLIALGFIGVAIALWMIQPRETIEEQVFQVPEEVNPFTVLSLLKDIKHRNGISQKEADELDTSINRIESYYFGQREADNAPGDLEKVARTWVDRAKV